MDKKKNRMKVSKEKFSALTSAESKNKETKKKARSGPDVRKAMYGKDA